MRVKFIGSAVVEHVISIALPLEKRMQLIFNYFISLFQTIETQLYFQYFLQANTGPCKVYLGSIIESSVFIENKVKTG